MRFIIGIGLAMAVVALGHAAPAPAQQLTTGTITGIVQDDQGLRMPGVTVEIKNEQTNDVRTTVSNEVGLFTMPALPLGQYSLKLVVEGFATVERLGIQLRSGEVYNAGTITLSVGALTQSTTVYAESAVVQTANAEKNSILEARAIESLVARGRDPLNLLRTMPGVQADLNTASLGATNGAAVPNIGGLLRSTVMLDGMIANDADTNAHVSIINIDAIAEIKVVSSGMAAEYGRSGGAQISFTSKSGTRNFHGSAAFFKRHDDLNATPLINKNNNLPKPYYRYNTLTGTLGGPVYIPNFLTGLRDKMFFFYTHEAWENKEPQGARTSTMPTCARTAGRLLADARHQRTPDLHPRSVALRCVQRDHRRTRLLSRQHHSGRSVRCGRPGAAEAVSRPELHRSGRQPRSVQLPRSGHPRRHQAARSAEGGLQRDAQGSTDGPLARLVSAHHRLWRHLRLRRQLELPSPGLHQEREEPADDLLAHLRRQSRERGLGVVSRHARDRARTAKTTVT